MSSTCHSAACPSLSTATAPGARQKRWGRGPQATPGKTDDVHKKQESVSEHNPSTGDVQCRVQGKHGTATEAASSAYPQPRAQEKVARPAQPGYMCQEGLWCPLMSPEEAALITVNFDDIESRLQNVLDEFGTAIVADIADRTECATMEQLFAEDISELVDHESLSTCGPRLKAAAADIRPREWSMEGVRSLGKMDRCQLRGLPHGRFAWAARLHPRVRRVYEVIHGTDKLVSSCDNSFFTSANAQRQNYNRNWPHVDQNLNDYSCFDEQGVHQGAWECYQGAVYVWDATGEHASTTVVWPGSHRAPYEEAMSNSVMVNAGKKGNHFCQLSKLTSGPGSGLAEAWPTAARRVPVPAGSLLLWSSRTFHQGWSGGPRLAQPVCWEPIGRRSALARERKLWIAALGLPSTHSAAWGKPHTLVAPSLEAKCVAQEGYRWTLPLRSTLQPVALEQDVDVMEMWRQLGGVNWEKTMRLPQPLLQLLERSISPRYLEVL